MLADSGGQTPTLHKTLEGALVKKLYSHLWGVKHGRAYIDFRFGVIFSLAVTVVAFWYVTPCNMLLNSRIAEESASLQH